MPPHPHSTDQQVVQSHTLEKAADKVADIEEKINKKVSYNNWLVDVVWIINFIMQIKNSNSKMNAIDTKFELLKVSKDTANDSYSFLTKKIQNSSLQLDQTLK